MDAAPRLVLQTSNPPSLLSSDDLREFPLPAASQPERPALSDTSHPIQPRLLESAEPRLLATFLIRQTRLPETACNRREPPTSVLDLQTSENEFPSSMASNIVTCQRPTRFGHGVARSTASPFASVTFPFNLTFFK